MGKPRAYVSFDYIKCATCSGVVCVGICPLGVLEVGSDGKPRVADVAECTACGVCVDLCPLKAIAIVRSEEPCEK